MNKISIGFALISFSLLLLNSYDIVNNSQQGFSRIDLLILTMTTLVLSQIFQNFVKRNSKRLDSLRSFDARNTNI